jgi:hypothetical protein
MRCPAAAARRAAPVCSLPPQMTASRPRLCLCDCGKEKIIMSLIYPEHIRKYVGVIKQNLDKAYYSFTYQNKELNIIIKKKFKFKTFIQRMNIAGSCLILFFIIILIDSAQCWLFRFLGPSGSDKSALIQIREDLKRENPDFTEWDDSFYFSLRSGIGYDMGRVTNM